MLISHYSKIVKQLKPKILLAYSGGLDTSVILKWLQTEYNADVIAYAADLGQGAELTEAKAKAKKLGAKKIYVENLKEEDIPMLTMKAYNIIKFELENDPKQAAVKAVNNWKKILD